jgi:hypothetical protein
MGQHSEPEKGKTCGNCNGSGKNSAGQDCSSCGGSGTY